MSRNDQDLLRKISDAILNPPGPPALRRILDETLFVNWDQAFLNTEVGRKCKDDLVFGRFNQALTHVVPWVARHTKLENCRVIEIGSGSGSSTAAFGLFCKEIRGFDISKGDLAAARSRSDYLGLKNVQLYHCTPENIISAALPEHDRADIVLLYAALEHMTIPERLTYLDRIWNSLSPGGLLVVVETPNRFTYMDYHTSEMPLMHLLPDDLAILYYNRSHREKFVKAMDRATSASREEAVETRIRWGLGVSHHEFELAIKEDLNEIVVGDAWDDHIKDMFPFNDDEDLFVRFFVSELDGVPAGFSRGTLSLIFRKPATPEDREAARTYNAQRREELKNRFPTVRRLYAAVDEKTRLLEQSSQVSQQEILALRTELAAVYSSASWRATTPLRLVKKILRAMLRTAQT